MYLYSIFSLGELNWKYICILFKTLNFLFYFLICLRELKKQSDRSSYEKFEGIISKQRFIKTQKFSFNYVIFNLVQKIYDFIFEIIFIVYLLPNLWYFSKKYSTSNNKVINEILATIIFVLNFKLIELVLNLPFSFYKNIYLERKYKNNNNLLYFLIDNFFLFIKTIYFSPIISIIIYTIRNINILNNYYFILLLFITFIVDLLYSKIEPLLNELIPLEGEMKDIIVQWCNKVGYQVYCDNIYIINTAGPIDDVDIYCCGLDKKSLVICGNLLSNCSVDEVLAILVQSLAHNKLNHNLKFIGISTIQRFISFYLLRIVLLSNKVYQDMGFTRYGISDSPATIYNSIYVGTLIFSYLYSPLNLIFNLLSSAIKLKFENEADLYCIQQWGFDMSKALKSIIRFEKVNPIYDYYFSLMTFNNHLKQNYFLRLDFIEKIKLKLK